MNDRKMPGKPVVLSWSQICHVAVALGAHPIGGGVSAAIELRKRLLGAGKIKQVARGRYQLISENHAE